MNTSPIKSQEPLLPKPLEPSQVVNGKEIRDEVIEQAAKHVLPPETVPSKPQAEGGWWSWMWGTGKKEEPKVQEKVQEEEQEEEGLFGFGDEDFRSNAESELSSDEIEEEFFDVSEGEEGDVSTESTEKKEPVEETLVKTYKATQATTWQWIKGGITGGIGNLAARAAAPGVRIYTNVYKGWWVNKEGSIAKAKGEMLNQLQDPRFVEFYDMAKTIISPIIKDKLDSFEGKTDVATTSYILPNRELIIDLLEINLARGFANLARQVRQNRASIPNYNKQPTLVSILSLLSQKAGAHIDAKQLSDLEEKYRGARKALRDQTQALFPGIDQQPKVDEAVQKYINEYIKSKDADRKNDIKHALFPNIDSVIGKKEKDIEAFFATLDKLHERDQEFRQLFSLISDDVLLYLFPNKFADMEVPGGLSQKHWKMTDWIYGKIKDSMYREVKDLLTNFLQESFDPLENDFVRNGAWEDELQTKVGAPDLKTVIQAPSSLLGAFAKNYIQANPNAMKVVAQSIDSQIHPTAVGIVTRHLNVLKLIIQNHKDNTNDKKTIESLEKDKKTIESLEKEVKNVGTKAQNLQAIRDLSRDLDKLQTKAITRSHIDQLKAQLKDLIKEAQLKDQIKAARESAPEKNDSELVADEKDLLNQLSQEQLANWIVESAQAMLNTQDPNLTGLGKFIQQGVNNLALALMAKGAKLAIPKDKKIDPNAFAKEFSDRLVEKFSSMKKGEEITDQEWKDFVKDLPLPTFVKDLLVPHLIEQAKSLQTELQGPDLKDLQKVYAETEDKIRSYKGGEQLLSITEKVSDWIVEMVLEKNTGLITTFGLGDTIEELFAQYLPGVAINDDLKKWFKENVSAFGAPEKGKSPQSIVLLKQEIQAVLRKAMVDTIEKNFKNDSKDYAAQLLKNFQQAFKKTFADFNAEKRKKIDRALEIQAKIKEKDDGIAKIKQEIVKSLLKPLVKDLVPKTEEDALIQSLAELISKPDQTEVSEQDVLVLLKAKVETKNDEEELEIEQHAQILAKSVNQILLNRKPIGLEKVQISLIEDALNADIRSIRAENYIKSLIEKRDELLAELNKGYEDVSEHEDASEYEDTPWTDEQLQLVSKALILRNVEAPNHETLDDFVEALTVKIEEYRVIAKTRNLTQVEKQDLDQRALLNDLLEMDSKELKQLSEAVHTHITLEHAKKELQHLKGELKAKKDAVADLEQDKIKDAKAWSDAKEWMEQVLKSRQDINQLSKAIEDLQKELDGQLDTFQVLAEEFMGLLGLDKKENLDLTPYLQDKVWPYIESAKKSQIARLLFAQISPLLVSIDDIQKNKDKLNQIAKGDPFLGQLIHASAEDAIGRIPEFVTSYKPFAKEILMTLGVDEPTKEEIDGIEETLKQTMIELGKEGTDASKLKPSMLKPLVKGFVPEKEEDALSQSLAKLIDETAQIEISKQDVLDLLKAKVQTKNKKEEQKLEQQAQTLAKSVNQFLLNRGKANLIPKDLLDAYKKQFEGIDIPEDLEKGILEDLQSERIVEKIKAVVITPEEITQALNDVIPGATDLHTLIAPQLQAAIVGDDPIFKENREILQRFLEGTILRLFIKIAEANQGQDVLAVITQKLKDLAQNAKPDPDKSVEEVAREMIDQVLEEVLGIASLEDLDSIPPALRKVAYDKVKEQAYQQLTPLIMPIIEREQSRTELKEISGSNLLGHLCKALTKDVFALLPFGVKSYRPIAEELFKLLSGRAPTAAEIDDFAKEIGKLVKEKNVKNSSLVQAYAKVANQPLTPAVQGELKAKLKGLKAKDGKERKVKDEINNILMTTQELAAAILPFNVKKYRPIAEELFKLLSGNQPTAAQSADFTQEIAKLVKLKDIENSSLVQAYAKVTKQTLTVQDQEVLKAKLEARKAEDEIKDLSKDLSEYYKLQQAMDNELQGLINGSSEVYQNVSDFASTYIEGVLLKVFIGVAKKNPKQAGKDTLIALTENLLKVATTKYQEMKGGKKVEDVTKELNDAIMKDILGIDSPDDSPDVFEGLPDALKKTAYDAIKDQLGGLLLRIHQSLSNLDNSNAEVQAAKAQAKAFGSAKDVAAKGYLQILAEDLANMVVTAVPQSLAEIAGEKMKGVVKISKGIETYLEELSRGNLEMAKVLLNYTKGDQFQKLLGDNLATLADKNKLVDDKQKTADVLANLLLVPFSRVIEKAVSFEDERGAQFNQALMANFLKVGAGQLRSLNAAKELAAKDGRTAIRHQDFVKAAGDQLHPGVPTKPVTYQKSIDLIDERVYGKLNPEQQEASGKVYGKLTPEQAEKWQTEQGNVRQLMARMIETEVIKAAKVITLDDFIEEFEKIHLRVTGKELTRAQKQALKAPDDKGLTLRDVIRQESEEPNLQRQEEAYGPAIKATMKMLFPNGKKDLTFVPEELRGPVWKAFKKNLFPVLLPMLTELILEPAMINGIVLSSLEATRETLEKNIRDIREGKVVDIPLPEDYTHGELDQAAGELVFEVLKATTLPSWIKNFVLDAEKKGISDSMKKTMGESLLKQFNETFIQDKLKMALEKAVERINPETKKVDPAGRPRLSIDPRPREIKEQEALENAKKVQTDLKKVSREVVGLGISYLISSTWADAHKRFDKLVEKAFGKVGLKVKHALDAVFGFIFFKIIGTILSVLFWPVKQLVKEIIYRVISLDKNRDAILGMLTQVPTDQPLTGTNTNSYAVYNEDLIFKLGKALNQTVQEILKQPVLPKPAEEKAATA